MAKTLWHGRMTASPFLLAMIKPVLLILAVTGYLFSIDQRPRPQPAAATLVRRTVNEIIEYRSINFTTLLSRVNRSFATMATTPTTAQIIEDGSLSSSMRTSSFRPMMSDAEQILLREILVVLVDVLERLKVTYFIYSGTLIGSYRHHGLVPWDDDVDLQVDAAGRHRLRSELERLEPEYGLTPITEYQWKFFARSSPPVPGHRYHYPLVDVMFFRYNSETLWDASRISHALHSRSDLRLIFPLVRRPFWDVLLYAPRHTDRYLRINYDMGRCVANSMSHRLERPFRSVSTTDCSALRAVYPFVVRSGSSVDGVNETLRLGDETLGWFTQRILD